MSSYQKKKKKIYKIYQKTKTQFEETEQVSEPYMVGMLELSGQEFKTSVVNMLRDLMDKEENRWIMLRKEMEILRKNQKKMLEIKNTVTEIMSPTK